MTVIESERLVMRPFTPADAEEFFVLNSNPEVVRYTGQAAFASVDEAREALRAAPLHDYETHGFGRHACILKTTGQLVGFTGFKCLPERDGDVDLGYRFLPECWGKGVATESCLAVLPWAFESLGLDRVIGMVEMGNPASSRVLEKCGFASAGTTIYFDEEVLLFERGPSA
ncbi:GNAT family N-acetyltransferase [bacterium AH-315-N03]|nr:GNAT family N-acetyltransferase [bacterium AH-315-N03]